MIFLNPGNPRFRQPCHFSGMRNCRVATAIAAAPQKGWFTTPLRLYSGNPNVGIGKLALCRH
jgi:hypothetical protein